MTASGLVLGIESSCDETAAAVVGNGREILSSVVHSQAAEHAVYGGVVPEVASRSHLRSILPVIDAALESAGVGLEQLQAIAVTREPGLMGSLLVGLSAAKGLSLACRLPLVPVHHIHAHAYAACMGLPEGAVRLPCLALVVSGGHTALYRMRSYEDFELVAQTLDDAAGEAFDKVAWLLGLEYPGGPSVSRLASEGRPDAIHFPRYQPRGAEPGFSFSGLKTAVLYHLRGQNALAPTPAAQDILDRADVAASFEQAVVDVLVGQTLAAAARLGLDTVLVTGGVACNARLRKVMGERASSLGYRALFPPPAYCTDNAAMIAGLGWQLLRLDRGAPLCVDARPN